MAEIVTLAEAVREVVHDGDTVALEGFTHLIPNQAGHEVIRQGRRELSAGEPATGAVETGSGHEKRRRNASEAERDRTDVL